MTHLVRNAVRLPEHRRAFTIGLGDPMDTAQALDLLSIAPEHDRERELTLPHHLRRYAVLRLFGFNAPIRSQLELVERVGMVIRNGYVRRDPESGMHRKTFLATAAAIEDFKAGASYEEVQARLAVPQDNDAVGFALVGPPGLGKTRTINRILASYPPKLVPVLPYHVVQVPWLKVEAPSTGGRKQFCISFVSALAERVGVDYSKMYAMKGLAGDHMMLNVQHLSALHALGVLVIDEIQHLLDSPEGTKPLMNFLVTLVNRIGVPVILIGTNAAHAVIQKDFREARRASGLGQPNWRPLQGEEWEDWLAEMWDYQWTNVRTVLTPEISRRILHESAGIIDIAVKLFILAQIRAIYRGETLGLPETLHEGLFAAVAKDEFACVRPMIEALRDGREDLLAQYPDLKPLHQHVDGVIANGMRMTMDEFRTLRRVSELTKAAEKAASTSSWASIRASLRARSMAEDVIDRLLAEALERNPDGDVLSMAQTVGELLQVQPRTSQAASRRRSIKAKPVYQADDLRYAIDHEPASEFVKGLI